MAFKEIDPGFWTYEKDGDFIEGILVKSESDVGENKSHLYSVETSPGEFSSIWGSTVLDQRMALVKVGSKVRITFKGYAEGKAGRNPAKLFKVEVDTE